MKNTTKALVLLVVCIVTLFALSLISLASSNKSELVVDNEDIFTPAQEEELENLLYNYSKEHECELVILTTSYYGGDIQKYAENFYDNNGYGYGNDGNGVLLLISRYDRAYYICTTGKATEAFSYSRMDELESNIVSALKKNDYYGAGEAFAKTANSILDSYNGFYLGDFIGGMVITVILAIVIGAVTIVAMRKQMNNARPQKNATQYVRYGSFELTLARDMYLYSTIRRVARPKKSSSGGGGGGRSHGGCGGRF